MSLNVLSRLLPYGLLALVGIAGWAMESTALLSVVVLGTAGVAIGTSMASRPVVAKAERSSIVDLRETTRSDT